LEQSIATNHRLPFPAGFLWGTATAAHQVEGNNTNNDWWAFEQQPGAIWQGDRSGLACDWWRNAERDLDLMAQRSCLPFSRDPIIRHSERPKGAKNLS
jgi:beta-glucosidase